MGLLIICLTLFLTKVIADNKGHCDFMGITEDDWENGYFYGKVTDYTEVFVTLGSNTPVEFVMETSAYITTTVNTSTSIVHFETKKSYFNLDEDTPTTLEDVVEISGNFTYLCPDGNSTLTFLLMVQDSNNHYPEFNEISYEFKLPDKTYEDGEDISQYGPDIIVTDIDFSNQNITFALTPGVGVTIETEILGNKKYRAVLKANNISNLDPALVHNIVAFDEPWRSDELHHSDMKQINFVKVPLKKEELV